MLIIYYYAIYPRIQKAILGLPGKWSVFTRENYWAKLMADRIPMRYRTFSFTYFHAKSMMGRCGGRRAVYGGMSDYYYTETKRWGKLNDLCRFVMESWSCVLKLLCHGHLQYQFLLTAHPLAAWWTLAIWFVLNPSRFVIMAVFIGLFGNIGIGYYMYTLGARLLPAPLGCPMNI